MRILFKRKYVYIYRLCDIFKKYQNFIFEIVFD